MSHMDDVSEPFRPADALLSFAAENVRSYASEVHLSLLGTRLSEPDVIRDIG